MLEVSQYSALAKLAALICLVHLVLRSAIRRKALPLPLPPGPRRLPILGNVLQMPRERIERGFAKIAEKYGALRLVPFQGMTILTLPTQGDLVYLEVLGMRVLVLNSQTVARDLLEKRGARYSNRPRTVRISEV